MEVSTPPTSNHSALENSTLPSYTLRTATATPFKDTGPLPYSLSFKRILFTRYFLQAEDSTPSIFGSDL